MNWDSIELIMNSGLWVTNTTINPGYKVTINTFDTGKLPL